MTASDALPAGGAAALRELVLQFESLGGAGHGCEFGIFQRSFGAEPLGLLRWADLNHPQLTEALNSRFEGVGDPANTDVFVPGLDSDAEYWTRDRRYWMAMRSFIRADSIPQEKMEVQAFRRLQYLRRKLIEDLEEGSKLFVFKNMFRDLTGQELDSLHQAVRSYGAKTTLFYVRYADAENPAGTVRLVRPGLIVGHIAHFAFSPANEQLPPATQHWLALCKGAFAVWRGETVTSDSGFAGVGAAKGPPTPPAEATPTKSVESIVTRDLDAAGYSAAARGLREKHQLDEADVLLAEGTERYTDHAGLLVDYCTLAQDRRAWPVALQRWERLQRDFPNEQRGYIGAALALREMQRLDEAEALLAEAIERFPGRPLPQIHLAYCAQQRGALSEAVERWAQVRQNFPAEMVAYVHGAIALRDLKRFDEADALLNEAIERFPDRREPLMHHAVLAEHRQDWPVALGRWSRAREQFPDDHSGYLPATAILRQLGRLDEAETIIAEALERFPSDKRVVFEAADLATRRVAWALALKRWQEARRRFPDDPRIDARIHDAQMRLLESDQDAPASPPRDTAIAASGQNGNNEESRLRATEPPTAAESMIGATKQDEVPRGKLGRVVRALRTMSSQVRGTTPDTGRR